jgi:uncharacterized membrane protein HdeD (DUF308 family)
MIETIKKSMKGMILYTIIMLVVGIIFAVNPGTSINIMNMFIAVVAMLIGGYFVFDYIRTPRETKLLSFSLAFGIVLIGIGLFIFVNPDALVKFAIKLVGIILIVKAIYKLQIALNIRKVSKAWKYNLLVSLLTLTMGLIMIIYTDGTAEWFLRVIGIFIALGAIGELIESAYVMGTIKDIKDAISSDSKEIPFEEK